MTLQDNARRLVELGYAAEGETDEDLGAVVKRFQARNDLRVDGVLGPITARALHAPRVCAVHDYSENRSPMCRFDGPAWDGTKWIGTPRPLRIEWGLHESVDAAFAESLAWAWAEWAKVCAIQPVQVERNPRDVLYTHANIDGPSGTLAWAELPCGPDRQLESRIDASENWHFDPTTAPARGRIHLGGVMCHENGHLLGLEHDTTAARSLLDPTYGPDVLTPQTWDIAQAQRRYGPPLAATPEPGPSPAPAPGDTMSAAVTHNGVTYRGNLEPAA